jgi:hypothetical protein
MAHSFLDKRFGLECVKQWQIMALKTTSPLVQVKDYLGQTG